jgi:three-Cys-motif partner protein
MIVYSDGEQMSSRSFFSEPRIQSEIKTRIVSKYFKTWSKAILSTSQNKINIGFIDLFAGPGIFDDGTYSTPLRILQIALKEKTYCEKLIILYNDINSSYINSLRDAINSLTGIEKLRNKPIFKNLEVGKDVIDEVINLGRFPKLLFIDPWGYKGLTLDLINSLLEEWGSDCIFFFNYNRINAGLNNHLVKTHMISIFGEDGYYLLLNKTKNMNPIERETAIIEILTEILMDVQPKKYVIPFCFKNETGSRSTHYLFFLSKHFLGYNIMKGIMATESSETMQGVSSFTYCVADKNQPRLFNFSRPLDDLEEILMEDFQGKQISFLDLFKKHSVGRNFLEKNYRTVLLKMYGEGKINLYRPNKIIKKNTLPNDTVVVFQPKERNG